MLPLSYEVIAEPLSRWRAAARGARWRHLRAHHSATVRHGRSYLRSSQSAPKVAQKCLHVPVRRDVDIHSVFVCLKTPSPLSLVDIHSGLNLDVLD